MASRRPARPSLHPDQQAGAAVRAVRRLDAPGVEGEPRAGALVLVLALAVAAFALIPSLTYPAVPHLQRQFDTDQATITWVITAYLASAAVLTPILGRLGDVVGRGRLLTACLVVLSVGSLLAALAPTVELLIAARVVQGAAGGVLPLAYAIVREHLPAHRSPAVVGLLSSLTAVAGGVGLVLAGPVITALGHQALFWIPLGATTVAATVGAFVIPRGSTGPVEPLPLLGCGLFAVGMVSALIGLSQGASWGWSSAPVLGLGGLAGLGFAGQWLVDRGRGAAAFVDARLLRSRPVALGHLVGFLAGLAMYSAFAFVAPLLQTPASAGGFGASTSTAGLLMVPCAAMSFLGGILAAHVAARTGIPALLAAGAVLAAGGMVGIAFSAGTRPVFVVAYAAFGLGLGAVVVCLTNHLLDTVPPTRLAATTGMNANLRVVGGAVGTALLTGIVADGESPADYRVAFMVLAATLVLAAVAAAALVTVRNERLSSGQPTEDAKISIKTNESLVSNARVKP